MSCLNVTLTRKHLLAKCSLVCSLGASPGTIANEGFIMRDDGKYLYLKGGGMLLVKTMNNINETIK